MFADDDYCTDGVDFNTHAMNSIFVLIDVFVCATPMRLLHVYQTAILGIYYSIFSVIYYAAGGTNPSGHPYIYEILDWREPGYAVLICCMGCFVAVPLTWFGLFGLYKLRLKLHNNSIETDSDSFVSKESTECSGVTNIAYISE